MLSKFKPFLLFATVFLLSLRPLMDTDFGWHLRVGEFILKTRSIPFHDLFSFSLPNYPYVYHSWAGEILEYLAFSAGGLWAVSFLFAFISTLSLFFIYKSSKLISGKIYPLVILWGAAAAAGSSMRIFSLLFLSIIYYLFLKYKNHNSKLVWLIPPVFILWSNFHGAFVLGIFIMFFLSALLIKKQPFKKTQTLFFVSFISALSTLINPYSYRAIFQSVQMSINSIFYLKGVNFDWLPIYLQGKEGAAVIAIIVLFIVLSKFAKPKTENFYFVAMLPFLVLTVFVSRFSFVLFVLFVPLANALIGEIATKLNRQILKSPTLKITILASYLILGLICVKNIAEINFAYQSSKNYSTFINNKYQNLISYDFWPYEEINFLQRPELLGKNVLAEAGASGYLLFQNPSSKVFYYGAMDNFIVQKRSFAFEYLDLTQARPGWEEKLNGYQIEVVALPKKFPLTSKLSQNAAWQKIYEDSQSVVYIKN